MNNVIKIVKEKISEEELKSFLGRPFDDMVKFVIDTEKEIIALGGEMHSDAEEVLLQNGSVQKDLWGANIYPLKENEDRIEFISLINIRPSQNNRSMEIEDENIKNKVKKIIEKLLI